MGSHKGKIDLGQSDLFDSGSHPTVKNSITCGIKDAQVMRFTETADIAENELPEVSEITSMRTWGICG